MERRIPIRLDDDIVDARLAARAMAEEIGFSGTNLVLIATAVSEVARNILDYASRGEVVVSPLDDRRKGIAVIARDEGPGIANVARAMEPGYSTSRGLGLGLPGARRLMDEFEIVSRVGVGTTVTMRKWLS
jgi:serine/threonine-protein kinase RsbT